MKKIYFLIAIIVLVLAGGLYFGFSKAANSTIRIKDQTFKVEVADTDKERDKGLAGKTKLKSNEGMIFVFDTPDIYAFWMKDTKIPLDLIWLAPDNPEGISKIVEMTTLEAEKPDNIPTYTPKNIAKYVLEVNAGISKQNNFKIGDEVKINL